MFTCFSLAIREAVQESLGFSPFELVFGRNVRGPLKLVKENWLAEDAPTNLLDQVSNLCSRLTRASELAQKNLKVLQHKMKTWYDKKARRRSFRVGEKVLALLPIPKSPLQARFCRPYLITRKASDVNYIIHTPDRRKSQRFCHVNMLKKYHEREKNVNIKPVASVTMMEESEDVLFRDDVIGGSIKLKNSDVLANLQQKLCHLHVLEREEMSSFLSEFADLFPDVPGRADLVCHDVDVKGATPIKQHPYRTNPVKLEFLRKEIELCWPMI